MRTNDRFTPTKNFRFQKFGLRCRPNGSTGRVRWQNFLLSRISFANKVKLDLAVFSGLQRKFLAQYQVGENTGLLHFNQLVLVVVNNFRLVLNATLLSAFWCAVVLPRKFWKICFLELLEYVSSGDIGAEDVRGGILFVPSTIYQEYGKYVTLHFNKETEPGRATKDTTVYSLVINAPLPPTAQHLGPGSSAVGIVVQQS